MLGRLRLEKQKQPCLGLSGAGFRQVLMSADLFIGFRHQNSAVSVIAGLQIQALMQPSFNSPKTNRKGSREAASQQQSPLITVRAISKNPDEGYKGLSLQKRFHYSFLSLPFLCLAKKRNKGGTLLIEN